MLLPLSSPPQLGKLPVSELEISQLFIIQNYWIILSK